MAVAGLATITTSPAHALVQSRTPSTAAAPNRVRVIPFDLAISFYASSPKAEASGVNAR